MHHRCLLMLLAAAALLLPSCGRSNAPGTSGANSAAQARSPATGSSEPSGAGATPGDLSPAATPSDDSAGTPIDGPTGSIEGVVSFEGQQVPEPTMVSNTTDPDICGIQLSKRDVEISPDTRGIRYVLIWLEDVQLPEGYRPPRQDLILDNTKCQFEPHAAAITVGSVIDTRNSDEVYHTTNLLGRVTKENIPLVSKGSSYKTRTRAAELIGVKCDKHGWMQAFIRVDPHPFHAVSDAEGKFAIAGVPVGTYKLRTWHEVFRDQTAEVSVQEDETTKLELRYSQ